MNRIRIDKDIKPMSEFRSGISSFVQQVHDTKRPMVITQHGKGVAVLVDVSEFESIAGKTGTSGRSSNRIRTNQSWKRHNP